MTTKKTETKKETKKESANIMKASVQESRNKATAMLRMVRVNEYLAKIFNTKSSLERTKTSKENFIKDIARKLRNIEGNIFDTKELINALKKEDPRYDEKKESLDNDLKSLEESKTKRVPEIEKEKEDGITSYDNEIKKYEDRIAELEGFIVKTEKGEIKMQIDEVNALAEKLILGN